MTARRGSVANAVDFRNRFQTAIGEYEEKVLLRLRELQQAMDPVLGGKPVDVELEAHIRTYVIDPLLSSLNWTTNENLTIEALVRSEETGNRRRLDYLGTESNTLRPLLVVEAKRPSAPRPEADRNHDRSRSQILADALSQLKLNPDKALDLTKSWDEWIRTLYDYINSLADVPVRVAMTNGEWLIVFEEPRNAFVGADPVLPDAISYYSSRDEILKNAGKVFQSLNYDSMVPFGRALEVGELMGLVQAARVKEVMHAARITYVDTETGVGVVPTLHLVPELLLFLGDGGWVRVFTNAAFKLPHNPAELSQHLTEVADAQGALLQSVSAALGRALPLVPLIDRYNSSWLGVHVAGVARLDNRTHLVALGTSTHFVVSSDAHDGCPFHRAAGAAAANAALDVIIAKPSSQHVTHFGDQSPNHCAHRMMRQVREKQIADHNREAFQPRGTLEDGPFCKLWGFEHYLCCHKCAFNAVCFQSVGGAAPCQVDV